MSKLEDRILFEKDRRLFGKDRIHFVKDSIVNGKDLLFYAETVYFQSGPYTSKNRILYHLIELGLVIRDPNLG